MASIVKRILFALVLGGPLAACDSGASHGTNQDGSRDGHDDNDGSDGPASDAGTDQDASAGAGGPLQIKATIDRCPVVLPVASPSSAKVGGSIMVAATVVDPDADQMTFLWSASSGIFGQPSAATTDYTCDRSGVAILTIAVSDGHCVGEVALPVTCQ